MIYYSIVIPIAHLVVNESGGVVDKRLKSIGENQKVVMEKPKLILLQIDK